METTNSIPSVTIGFVPRESFSKAARSLQSIYTHTNIPFNLVIVNCNIPEKYWKEIEEVIKEKTNVTVIRRDNYLFPSQSKNLVIETSRDDYICFIENDCFVLSDDWLKFMIMSCESFPADCATPLLFEGTKNPEKIHHDRGFECIETKEQDGETIYSFVDKEGIDGRIDWNLPHKIETMEHHCMLFKRSVFEKIGPFDEKIISGEYIDTSLALYTAGIPMIIEPRAKVHFCGPPPIQKGEMEFFRFRWNVEKSIAGNFHMHSKWKIASNNPENYGRFVRGQQYRTSNFKWLTHRGMNFSKRMLKKLIPIGK